VHLRFVYYSDQLHAATAAGLCIHVKLACCVQSNATLESYLYVSISMMIGPCSSAYFLANSIDCKGTA
jgi:hypothetical protein